MRLGENAMPLKKRRDARRHEKFVIITGAGVTVNTTLREDGKPLDSTTWKGLILNGWRYLVHTLHVAKSEFRIKTACAGLNNSSGADLILAASIVKEELDKRNKFSTRLETVFENLESEVTNPGILEVLKVLQDKKRAKLFTTNYDDVLDKYCGMSLARRSQKPLQEFKLNKLESVFHIHGCWDDL
jgi:NAD-dependent SIR2 family protein deacetylase